MKRKLRLILVVFGILLTLPAPAWSLGNSEVKSPAAAGEVKKEQGFWAGVKETGRDIGRYFKGAGKAAKKKNKKVPGELKEEGRAAGRSIKKAPNALGREVREGGKLIGRDFKELGRDFKEAADSVLDGDPKRP
ncbi:MAG: hypothetical protein LC633_07370 [Desulfobulbaceae bacterium]|nr:hypothetical protein [Desulfobulbaceae bacterium]